MQCRKLHICSIYSIILDEKGAVILGELRFIVYDVQHGSCSHIITPANQHIIIDLGPKPKPAFANA